MKAAMETDIEEVWRKFQELTAVEMTKCIKRCVNAGAVALKQDTLAQLHSTGISIGHNPKFSDTLDEGVRMVKARGNYDEDISSMVHILGTWGSGSGSFRLRFFENGTKDRYQKQNNGVPLRKPKYIGAIKPYGFFKAANSMLESKLDQIYMAELDKAINKINREQ